MGEKNCTLKIEEGFNIWFEVFDRYDKRSDGNPFSFGFFRVNADIEKLCWEDCHYPIIKLGIEEVENEEYKCFIREAQIDIVDPDNFEFINDVFKDVQEIRETCKDDSLESIINYFSNRYKYGRPANIIQKLGIN